MLEALARAARIARRFVGGGAVAGAGLAGLALVGCGDDDDDDDGGGTATATATGTGTAATATATAAQPKTGGTLRVHMGGSPRSLDPHFDTFPYNTAVTNNTNERLLKWAADFSEIQTELADAMPEQADELTFTFKIKSGIKFHNVDPVNGREFTSEDVKYSIERQMTDEAGKYQHAYFFLNRIDTIETPDATTVVFKTKAPYAPFLSYMASPWTVMIAREAVEKFGA